ncbi:MAG: BREX system ATP-binding domain-containing protein [Mycobacteriales bacterium]
MSAARHATDRFDASRHGDPVVANRRAVEALRAGVPSLDAVAALGSGQTEIEDEFLGLLEATREDSGGGMLVGGGFGSGKSHLLEHLAKLALDDGFVVSRVVISKETPLHDPVKVYRAAAETATAAGSNGSSIAEAAAELDLDGPSYAQLLRWSMSAELNQRFPASLLLLARLREHDAEYADTLVRFWAGDPIAVPEFRRRLKAIGEHPVVLPPVPARELGRQRLAFTAKLLAAAGHSGWLILFDETELIGRYSLLQRGKSYAELTRWVRGDHGTPGLPIAAVLAMTDDFEAAVLSGKNDRVMVPAKLRAKGTPEATELASHAEAGMSIIDEQMSLLTPPDAAELDRAYLRLKALHGSAFDWEPPNVAGLERLGATRMRQYVRAWINEWDLVRIDPDYRPDTQIDNISSNYREDAEESTDVETDG